MRKFLAAGVLACLQLFALCASATDSTATPVKLIFDKQRINDNEVLLSIKATIAPGIKLYGLQKTDADALYSTITFDSAANKYVAGKVMEKAQRNQKKILP